MITMSIVLNFICSLPVIISIVLTYACADNTILVEIVDRSRSEICPSGLLHLRDAMDLEITVSFVNPESIRSNKAFVLELQDLRDMYKTKICYVRYSLECIRGIDVHEGCFCHNSTDGVHYIRYFAAAHVDYSENVIWVNGKVHDGLKMPKIFPADNITLSVQVNGLDVRLFNQTCLTVVDGETFTINFCAHGLTHPNLTVSYGDSLAANESKGCIAAQFTSLNETTALEFSYEGRCTSLTTLNCTVEVIEVIIVTEKISTLQISLLITMFVLMGVSVLYSIYSSFGRNLFTLYFGNSDRSTDESDSSSVSNASEKTKEIDYVSSVVL